MGQYDGNLNFLRAKASEARDVEARLKTLDKGIGDVTVNIFSREMRGAWEKANPLPSDLVVMAASNLGLIPDDMRDRNMIL